MTSPMRTALALALLAGTAAAQVQHGVITVVENDADNIDASVTETRAPGGFGAWTVLGGDRGDIDVDFGNTSDVAAGILLTAPAQNGRTEPSVNAGAAPYYFTTHARPGGILSGDLNKWSIPVQGAPSGSEVNADVTVAYFPYADGWLGGYGWNDDDGDDSFANDLNGGVITDFIGGQPVSICNLFLGCTGVGVEILDQGNGDFLVHIPGADVRRQGVALLVGAKNEDNFGLVSTAGRDLDGGQDEYPTQFDRRSTIILTVKDNGDNGSGSEQDPFGFVWIPQNTPGVTMGNFTGQSVKLFSQGDWDVTRTDVGTFRLTIADESPATGTLFVQNATGDSLNEDNVVGVQPDGDGWIIETRDIAAMGLQDLAGAVVAHFAFFPDDVEITGPGTPDPIDSAVIDTPASATFLIEELGPDNTIADLDGTNDITDGRLILGGLNRGDVTLAFAQGLINDLDGVTIPIITEFVRDNSATGGISGDGAASWDQGQARTFNADGLGGEMNINFGAAHFPITSGFVQGFDISTGGSVSGIDLVNPGSGDDQNGVLIATNWDNNNRTTLVNPITDGFNVTAYEAQPDAGGTFAIGDVATNSVEIGFVYLPYNTPDLVAGQIDASGDTINGTGDFTVASGVEDEFGFPVWVLTIPGVDSNTDGVLLFNPSGTESTQYAYEARADGSFELGFLRLADQTEILPGFSFAFVPSTGFTTSLGCSPADLSSASNPGVPDGVLTGADFFEFLARFQAGDLSIDFSSAANPGVPDGVLTGADFFEFLNLFSAGC